MWKFVFEEKHIFGREGFVFTNLQIYISILNFKSNACDMKHKITRINIEIASKKPK